MLLGIDSRHVSAHNLANTPRFAHSDHIIIALAQVALEDRAEYVKLVKDACMSQFDSQIELVRSGLDDYQIPTVALLLWTPQEFQEKVLRISHTHCTEMILLLF